MPSWKEHHGDNVLMDAVSVVTSKRAYNNANATFSLLGHLQDFGWIKDSNHTIVKNIMSKNAQGSMRMKGSRGLAPVVKSEGFFQIEPEMFTRGEIDLMAPADSEQQNPTNYMVLSQFDAEQNEINVLNCVYYSDTVTTLTQDLNYGDTVVHVADVQGFIDRNAQGRHSIRHRRRLSFWPKQEDGTHRYVGADGAGYAYDELGYTRKTTGYDIFGETQAFDAVNNTITLNRPWSPYAGRGGNMSEFKAGDKVANGTVGYTYKYLITNAAIVADGTFKELRSVWSKGTDLPNGTINQTINGVKTTTWNGAFYFKLGMLPAYNATSGNALTYVSVFGVRQSDTNT